MHSETVLSESVRKAFRLSGGATRLPGGSEVSLLIGDTVVKEVLDPDVGVWLQWLTSKLCRQGNIGFRVPEPIATESGQWIHDGWIASRFIPGLTSLADHPSEAVRVGKRFSAAATETATMATRNRADVLAPVIARTDRWARGFRRAMETAPKMIHGEDGTVVDSTVVDGTVVDRLAVHVKHQADSSRPAHPPVIHCDLTGNVFIDKGNVPVVLDISPGLAEVGVGTAIVVADHLLWRDGNVELVDLLAGRIDLLARALLFRLHSEQLALDLGQRPAHGAVVDDYHRVLSLLDW